MAVHPGEVTNGILEYELPGIDTAPVISPLDFEIVAGVVNGVLTAGAAQGGAVRTGVLCVSAWEQIEERIIAKPNFTDLGVVAATVIRTGLVWNNHKTLDVTVDSVSHFPFDAGVAMTGLAPASVILKTRDATVTYTISPFGIPALQSCHTFFFTNGEGGGIFHCFLGIRSPLIHVPPLWDGYEEARDWLTDVTRSQDGTEAREGMASSTKPSRRISIQWKASNRQEQQLIENFLQYSANNDVTAPLWISLMRLTAPAAGFSVTASPDGGELVTGGHVMFLNPATLAFTVREVASFSGVGTVTIGLTTTMTGAGFTTGDYVIPIMRVSHPEGAKSTVSGDGLRRGLYSAEFLEL